MKLGHVTLNSAKMKANASKHKTLSYQQTQEKEEQLSAGVAGGAAPGRGGRGRRPQVWEGQRGDELPEELVFREGRLERLQEPMEVLEAEPGRKRKKLRSMAGNILECPTTRPSATSPTLSPRIIPASRVAGTSCGRNRQRQIRRWRTRTLGDRGGLYHQPAFGQAAGRGNGSGAHRQ